MAKYCKKCSVGQPCPFTHGTAQGYGYHRCRCAECRQKRADLARNAYRRDPAAAAQRMREYRAANADLVNSWPSSDRGRIDAANIRWREANPGKVAQKAAREEAARQRVPVRRSWAWTAAEDAILLSHNGTLLELAYLLGRTYGAVQLRRWRLRSGISVRRNQRWSHGSNSGYRNRCRCNACKSAHAKANNAQYHARRAKEQAA